MRGRPGFPFPFFVNKNYVIRGIPLGETGGMRSQTIFLSTSTFENAVETLLNAGCFEHEEDAKETAVRHFEHVFPIEIRER